MIATGRLSSATAIEVPISLTKSLTSHSSKSTRRKWRYKLYKTFNREKNDPTLVVRPASLWCGQQMSERICETAGFADRTVCKVKMSCWNLSNSRGSNNEFDTKFDNPRRTRL